MANAAAWVGRRAHEAETATWTSKRLIRRGCLLENAKHNVAFLNLRI
jgi:hypothetical protein